MTEYLLTGLCLVQPDDLINSLGVALPPPNPAYSRHDEDYVDEPSVSNTPLDLERASKVLLKAPITTPQAGGFKSLNVTTRKMLGLYANLRPCVAYAPYVDTKHPNMNVVIVRENEEDLYAGIEHQQTPEVVQCLKLISRPGTEKIVRYAFEYARRYARKKVTCFIKDTIMKQTDGLFHAVFDEVAKEYPDLENEHWIVDIGAAKLADTPTIFDVIVMPNLYDDILSDVAAQIAGLVGLAGSSNIGEKVAMFEAIHGSAPRRAGQNLANPSGLLLGAVMMLVHIGQPDVAETVHNAWFKTLEDGIHTYDIFAEGISSQKVGTKEFAEAVIARMGQKPQKLEPVSYASADSEGFNVKVTPQAPKKIERVGVDIFLHHDDRDPERLGESLKHVTAGKMALIMITNRGVKVWPDGFAETFCTDHWRCRFKSETLQPSQYTDIMDLQQQLTEAGFRIIKTENLCTFDGQPVFSAGQGA